MSFALSSASPSSGTPPIGVSPAPEELSLKARLSNVQWARFPPSIVAAMGYLKHSPGKPLIYMYEPPRGIEQQNCEFEMVSMPITDARHLAHQPKIDVDGFELWEAPTEVVDFRNAQEVASQYYAEAADLVRGVTGAAEVIVFDHQIRQREAGRPSLTFGRADDGSKAGAVGRVHVDYSEETGRKRLHLVLRNQEIADSIARFAIINVWRSIKGPILDTPLAVCDARAVGANDLVAADIRYQSRSGEIYLVRRSNRHRWYYYSAMNRNEALVFKQYDSLVNGVSRFTPHGAFDHPDATEATPLRESIEVRCLAIFD